MDLSKLNPWRKTPTLYNWDNNWRPEIASLTVSANPLFWNWICPPEYYAELVCINANYRLDSGIGVDYFKLSAFRGNKRFYFKSQSNQPQLIDNRRVNFHIESIKDPDSARNLEIFTLGSIVRFIPGDRFEVEIVSAKVNVRFSDSFINLKAYYF